MKIAIIVCAAVGVATVAATVAVGHAKPDRATEEYGRRLMTAMVPHRLACASCHIDGGREPGELTLVNAVQHYPGDRIRERINECLGRNMNARPLPEHSDEMTAIVAWLRFVADEDQASGGQKPKSEWVLLDYEPTPEAGERIFAKRCADCHGNDGAGLAASRDPARGFLFPPLWGPESFPDGSEMNSVGTLAHFVKANMPPGRTDLDVHEAYAISEYLLSKPRPHSAQ